MNYRTKLLYLLPVLLMSGCQSFDEGNKFIDSSEAKVNSLTPPASKPVISTFNQPFLAGPMVTVDGSEPSFYTTDKITMLSTTPMSLDDVAAQITSATGLQVINEIQGTSDQSVMPSLPGMGSSTTVGNGSSQGSEISLNYNGNLGGYLKYIESKYGVWTKYENGQIIIFDKEAKTYTLALSNLPMKMLSTFVSASSAGVSSGSSTSSSSSGTGGTSQTNISVNSAGDPWSDVSKSITTIAGPGATVSVDPGLKSVTVFGTPPQIDRVTQYIDTLNQQSEQEVEIAVHVYNVTLSNEQNYGFNPTVAFASASKKYGLSFSGPTVPAVQTQGESAMSLAGSFGAGTMNGTNVAVQALATLGKVAQTFEQTLVTTNNQSVPLQVGKETTYINGTQATTTANVGSTNSVTTNTLQTGFTGWFQPTVVNGKILLAMSITMNNLDSLATTENVQLPISDDATVTQSVYMQPGQTLMLTGFKESDDQNTHTGVGSPFMALLGGGADANNANHMIAITVTATLANSGDQS